MKKTLLFVFCACLLLCASSAHAQTAQSASSTITLNSSGMVVQPMGVGTEYLGIVVTDLKGNPKPGVYVTAPCAGSPKYTDVHGTASWGPFSVCPCSQSSATATTTNCELSFKVSCGTTTVVCP